MKIVSAWTAGKQEVVSLGGGARDPEELAAAAAPHITPQAFHALLVGKARGGGPTVLLDVRNVYETRIGQMQAVGAGCGCSLGTGSQP